MTHTMMTRRELKNEILNRRAVRMQADQRADELPTVVWMHPRDRDDILIDDDPGTQWDVRFVGPQHWQFMGANIEVDPRIERGHIRLDWAYTLRGDL